MSEELDEAQRARNVAYLELQSIKERIAKAANDAASQVRATFRDDEAQLSKAFGAADRHLREVMAAKPDHPWTGKRVFRVRRSRSMWNRKETRIDGIVQMRKLDTQFPGNTSNYNLPDLGEPFIRLLKKDGTAGSRFEKFSDYFGWKLAEEEK